MRHRVLPVRYVAGRGECVGRGEAVPATRCRRTLPPASFQAAPWRASSAGTARHVVWHGELRTGAVHLLPPAASEARQSMSDEFRSSSRRREPRQFTQAASVVRVGAYAMSTVVARGARRGRQSPQRLQLTIASIRALSSNPSQRGVSRYVVKDACAYVRRVVCAPCASVAACEQEEV